MKSGSISIREHLAQVESLRLRAQGDPTLYSAVRAVKAFQAARFRGTYSDLLFDDRFHDATHFFLSELYGERDFSQRDQQFFRIAGALEKFFPDKVLQTASDLAALHALSERLDFAMAMAWTEQALDQDDSFRYTSAWTQVSSLPERLQQLEAVIGIGKELDRLTQLPSLRFALKMMRGPAKAAGLGTLQNFLEAGFDTFAAMARNGKLAAQFLNTIQTRENAWITALFRDPTQQTADQINKCLSQSRRTD